MTAPGNHVWEPRVARLLRRITPETHEPATTPAVRGDIVADSLDPVVAYCDVAAGHARDVIEQTGEAAEAIVEQLVKVDALADVMAGDVSRLAATLSRTRSELHQVSAANDQLVGRLVAYFLHRDQQVRELVDQIRGLDQHVQQIEAVSRATNILALNALIEAIRAGEAGQDSRSSPTRSANWPTARRRRQEAGGIGGSIAGLTAQLDAVLGQDSEFDENRQTPVAAAPTAMTRRLDGIA